MKTKPKFPNSTLEYKDGSMKKIEVKRRTKLIRVKGWVTRIIGYDWQYTHSRSHMKLWMSYLPQKGQPVYPATLLIHQDKAK